MNSLSEAAGQLFFFNFEGQEVTLEVERFVQETRPGGVVLFGRNLRSAAQIRELNRDLQRLALRRGLPPFIIAVDEEGGRVSRMPADLGGGIAPSQMAQAAAGGPQAAGMCAGTTARRLRRLGFTMNFAPVADVNSNPANPVIGIRAYGSDPMLVGECVGAATGAYLRGGIAPCAKHFPGHGDTYVDSHLALPAIEKSLVELEQIELVPFARAIAAGVPAIMAAHIVFPRIDPSGRPATLSPALLRGLLRERMGFEGLVFTDALDMKAVSAYCTLAEATRRALEAGACLLAPVAAFNDQYECYRALLRAAEEGAFDVGAEAARVSAHKARFVHPLLAELDRPVSFEQETRQVEAEEAAMAQVARRSLTVLGNRDGVLPVDRETVRQLLLVDFVLPAASLVEEGRRPGPLLSAALGERLLGLSTLPVRATPDASEARGALGRAEQADLLVVVTRNASRLPAQAGLVRQLLALGKPAIIVAAREPYDIPALPGAQAYVATYGDPPASMLALADLLAGRFESSGVLPVDMPADMPTDMPASIAGGEI